MTEPELEWGFSLTIRGVARGRGLLGKAHGAQVCLSLGHYEVAYTEPLDDGSFEVIVDGLEGGTYYLSVFSSHGPCVRIPIKVDDDLDDDLGTVELMDIDRRAGVWGLVWDRAGHHPVQGALVRLLQDEVSLGEASSDENGEFEIAMGCDRPMPPGEYQLMGEAGGYGPRRVPVRVTAERMEYPVGRLELEGTSS